MKAVLLGFILFTQGIPQAPADSGTVTGIVKTSSGAPAAGVRVSAMARATADGSTSSLTQTDEQGRYRLENIPSGSYVIAAGRVALPTFYPATLDMSKGTAVSVAGSAVVENINITMDDASIRPSDSATDVSDVAGLTLPVQVRMEGDAKQPIFADGRSVMVRFTRMKDGAVSESPLNASILNLPVPNSLPGYEYRVTIENLPSGYVVKSMVQDGVNLLNNSLKVTAKNFVQAEIPVYGAALPGAMLDKVRIAYGAGGPMIPMEITLAGAASNSNAGVRVRGKIRAGGNWEIALEGSAAILFADGSFECRGVTPGRHVILLQDKLASPVRVLAASVVAGDKDLNDVMVDDVVVMPKELQFPTRTPPAGTVVPLASIRGRVSDAASKNPVLGGAVTLSGANEATFPIDSEGLFLIPGLLPGSYDLTVEGSRHAAVRQVVLVGDEDVTLNISAP
jgi:5-hydroxyisourate hydrolase-like protein (transthyretin family)